MLTLHIRFGALTMDVHTSRDHQARGRYCCPWPPSLDTSLQWARSRRKYLSPRPAQRKGREGERPWRWMHLSQRQSIQGNDYAQASKSSKLLWWSGCAQQVHLALPPTPLVRQCRPCGLTLGGGGTPTGRPRSSIRCQSRRFGLD